MQWHTLCNISFSVRTKEQKTNIVFKLLIFNKEKKMKKKLAKASLMIAVCCFSLSMALPEQAKAGWLQDRYKANPVSVDQLDASYGTPVNVITIAKGVEKRIYGPKDVVIGYTYFITDNGQVIDRGVTDSAEKQASNKAISPEAKGIMANYYKANPLSVKELEEEMGAPVQTCSYVNGSQKLFYGPKDVVAGYNYFLVKDGMVIDKNVSGTLESNEIAVAYAGPEAKGRMAAYYASNPMTVDELRAKWGKHISNHDYDNGIKVLTFGPKDPEVGYTYFLVKDGMVIDKNVTGAN
jgi:hypothetical protein